LIPGIILFRKLFPRCWSGMRESWFNTSSRISWKSLEMLTTRWRRLGIISTWLATKLCRLIYDWLPYRLISRLKKTATVSYAFLGSGFRSLLPACLS